MRNIVIAASLAMVLGGAPAFAQATGQPAAAAPAPAPKPAPPAPAQTPPTPFPEGSKYAFVNLMLIYQNSAAGKAALAKVNALAQKKDAEVGEKVKAMQAIQQKLQSGEGVLSESARAQLEKDIAQLQRDGERFQQDAEAEVGQLNQEVQGEFYQKLYPVLVQLAKDKAVQVMFSGQSPAGVPPTVIWFEPGLDLSTEAVKRLDAASPASAAPPAASAPAAPKPAAPPAATPPTTP